MKWFIFFLILLLVFHHYYKHSNDSNKTTMEKFFQYSDVDNHETWIIFLIGILVGIRI